MVRAQCFVIQVGLPLRCHLDKGQQHQLQKRLAQLENISFVTSTGHALGSLGDDEVRYRDGRGWGEFPGSIFKSHSKNASPAPMELLHASNASTLISRRCQSCGAA